MADQQPFDVSAASVPDLFVRADEVDAGTKIPGQADNSPLSALTSTADETTTRPRPTPRPILKRETSTSTPPPPLPSQPPPAPPPETSDPTDSLSLPQLRQLVQRFPKIETRAYDYQFSEAEDFAVEIDEWFNYTRCEPDVDRNFLLASREAFDENWQAFQADGQAWTEVGLENRLEFVRDIQNRLPSQDTDARRKAIATLLYLACGTWHLTAGLPSDENQSGYLPSDNIVQVHCMHQNIDIIVRAGAVSELISATAKLLHTEQTPVRAQSDYFFDDGQLCELSLLFSCLYLTIESARERIHCEAGQTVRTALLQANTNLLMLITRSITKVRWEDTYNLPLHRAIFLFWKLGLLVFGSIDTHLEEIRIILQPRADAYAADAARPVLTTSPLDYHAFRQEIVSKYPAYNPPPPLIPLEIDERSILPILPSHASRVSGFDTAIKPPMGVSIMHQPVHIATPAPSPPPSPGGMGGKGGKKQNYQTNQNFPFMFPPLNKESNNIGGQGSAAHQDTTVGRPWEGSSIPASIVEASELFASRMRMTRATRQLWKERELWGKYERGWVYTDDTRGESVHEKLDNPHLQDKMEIVEQYFHQALPDLQYLVIVLMKTMLTNVQDIARSSAMFEAQQQGLLGRIKSGTNLSQQNNQFPQPPSPPRPDSLSVEELDSTRSREISQKGISACILMMLKWFKISHILKFEYMTQLLFDANYVPLTLKYFAHQNLEELVSFKYEREELSFWRYCQVHSDHPPLSPTSPSQSQPENEDGDDAIPPPIARHKKTDTVGSDNKKQNTPENKQEARQPLVDELGNPVNGTLPNEPIPRSQFSTRHFNTAICMLRNLQKITKGKNQRILSLVNLKSGQILRRLLRIPEPKLRLYVLKIFKSQVMFQGRKWRASNMRVITAIYLHCKPELRDEWLSGLHDGMLGHLGAEPQSDAYEEAAPLESAIRGLTSFWMRREYRDVLKLKPNEQNGASEPELVPSDDIEDDERDFFKRELDKMGWGLANMQTESDEVGFGEEALGVVSEVATNGTNGQYHFNSQQTNNFQTPAAERDTRQWSLESPNAVTGTGGPWQ